MERIIEIREHGIVVVNIGFGERSVEARNLLAQIAHLVSYEDPSSKQIIFRIDAKSIRQAAEWGVDRRVMLRKLRNLSGQLPSRLVVDQVHWQVWRRAKVGQEPGKYSSRLSRRPNFWGPLRIAQSFWVLKAFGKPLNPMSLPNTLQAALYKNGGWSFLVAYAGFDPEREAMVAVERISWSESVIIAKMRELKEQGSPVHVSWLQHHGYLTLYNAIRRFFGSWAAAVRAAGLDPEKEWRGAPQRLSRDEVVGKMLERRAQEESIRPKAVRLSDYNLYVSALLHFRTWPELLFAIGVDPQETLFASHSREDIVAAVQRLKAGGEPINSRYLRDVYPKLAHSIPHYFDSWEELVREAGFDPQEERRRRKWTREAVIEDLQVLKRRGEPINSGYLQRYYVPIASAIQKYYNGWENAVRAAGFDPERERSVVRWSKEVIIAKIKALYRRGEPVHHTYVQKHDRALEGAVLRYFDSWDEMLAASGLQNKGGN